MQSGASSGEWGGRKVALAHPDSVDTGTLELAEQAVNRQARTGAARLPTLGLYGLEK
ncbi:hypothetical protein SAMN05428963_108168 [Consotaella salsifontis]|uniref:Uncharacterized protein n=1 Tax=Consotaella salsifontis TaxID=1365950 RepID=A0A1T4S1G7_9HYPH|nr:hypothetical protein SAMN05428963_108168 [Consotaella salsifontis]